MCLYETIRTLFTERYVALFICAPSRQCLFFAFVQRGSVNVLIWLGIILNQMKYPSVLEFGLLKILIQNINFKYYMSKSNTKVRSFWWRLFRRIFAANASDFLWIFRLSIRIEIDFSAMNKTQSRSGHKSNDLERRDRHNWTIEDGLNGGFRVCVYPSIVKNTPSSRAFLSS